MQGKSKLKLLYIKDYLEAFSDEDNPVSAEEMIEMLREKGIECERKSIYSDIENLRRYGLEIFRVRAPKNGYFIGQGNFQTAELRILTDAVQAAEFITPQKTRELTEKIKTLCSAGRAKKLDSQMYIDGRAKCRNEQIYYNIDVLSRAIESGRQVSFIYSKRVVNGESAEIIREEKELTISPYAMLWSNDRYYLVGNNPKYDNLMHVRIDRMRHVEMTQSASRHFSEVSPYRNFFDTADYVSKLFYMFSGETAEIELICGSETLESILDRFGTAAEIAKCRGEGKFILTVHAALSEGLVSWLLQCGSAVEVASPPELRRRVIEKARAVCALYGDEAP